MIAKQVMQSTIEGIATIARIGIGVFDTEGRLVAASADLAVPDEALVAGDVRDFAGSPADAQELRGSLYFKVYDDDRLLYVLLVSGDGDNARLVGRMAAFQLTGLVVAYRERFDRDDFIKNLLLDNLLLVDIYSRAAKLRIEAEAPRACLVVRFAKDREPGTVEMVRAAAEVGERKQAADRDFVTEIDERDVIIVHEMPAEVEEQEDLFPARIRALKAYAAELLDRLGERGFEGLRISCGTVVRDLKEVSRSYKEANMALDVSRIFYEEERVICYSELGIGRLIYQLPVPLCKLFLYETFGDREPGREVDPEIAETVEALFENNLNLSETARKLFIHRNTLVYRLDKLMKTTGLDVRTFDDAITYSLAMMVVKYMEYMREEEF